MKVTATKAIKCFVKAYDLTKMSFRRRPESPYFNRLKIPAFAGMTIRADFAKRHLFITLIFAFLAVFYPYSHPKAEINASVGPTSIADLVEDLLPAVVNISSTQKAKTAQLHPLQDLPQFPEGSPFEDFFEEFFERRVPGMRSMPQSSLGSGFIIDAKQGYIVTNNHVVKDADEVRVTFHDDETVEAEVIGRDEKTDLAVLKVKTDKKLTAVTFGQSDGVRIGDWVVVIGNPFGLGGTVTTGIVSARQRDISAGPYDDFIQTDASINRGNSGGPMFDLEGHVIGINTAIFSPTGGSVGIGFAIPSALAKPVINQIVEYGRTRRGWLGVRIQKVTDEIAESLGLKDAEGALIAGVTEDGPADKAGIITGDIITHFNGKHIKEMRMLPRIVAEASINDKVPVEFWRDGEKLKAEVQIGELEKAEENGLLSEGYDMTSEGGHQLDEFGLTIQELTEELREEFDVIQRLDGIVITAVEDGSEADFKGLAEGDVIVEINQQRTETVDDVTGIVERAKQAGRRSVLFLVNRDGTVRFVALKLK